MKRCVGRTMDLLEAERLADSYRMQGFLVSIVRRKEGSAAMYEVWIEEKKEGFEIHRM